MPACTLQSWAIGACQRAKMPLQGMDCAGVDEQPQTNSSSSYSVFFIVFMTVMAFYMIRAFTGVFIKQVTPLSNSLPAN